jgi:4-diphosphocytidyl-2-C-methyl-D-erythritol kinase
MPHQETKKLAQSEKLTIFAPAKVNLHLAVKDRREDGFHNLESIFLALNFGDLLHFTLQGDTPCSSDNSIEIVMENPKSVTESCSVSVQDNIIYKTILLFREKTGFSQGLKVFVEKRIPLGGGLGGGSSNAAATLLILNKILEFQKKPLSCETLLDMAAALGSDVPFFIHETPAARVSGRGEIIDPVDEVPPMFLVLVNPGFHSDTARAFRLLDESRNKEKEFTHRTIGSRHKEHKGFGLNMKDFFNDFFNVFPEEEQRIYNEIISTLQSLGAFYANLSGSGATCFGVFNDEKQAQKAAEVLCAKWDFVKRCQPQCRLY